MQYSYKFHEGWFAFSGVRNRSSFLFAVLTYGLMYTGILWLFSQFPMTARIHMILVVMFSIAFIAVSYLITSQRLRDFGVNGWFALLWFPIGFLSNEFNLAFTVSFSLVLVLIPSRQETNQT